MDLEMSTLEFKREYTKDIKYTVVSFANSQGGVIKIGVDDQGNTVGLADIDGIMTQITNAIRDSIMPDITMFTDYSTTKDNGITITVKEGTKKPYYLKEKGMKPSGIYVRQGASSVPASWEQIRTMIKQTDGDKYEASRSFEQNLTFDYARDEFMRRGVPFEESNFISLGIMNLDRTYSNLGVLISDQCQHTIKAAVFNGIEKKVFQDRREFGGSVLKQLNDVFEYLDLHNKTHASISGLHRIDSRDYSELVVREALVNAIVHRDYSFSGSIIINLYDNKMELISLGGLVGGLTEHDIRFGISLTRNEKLAHIFYRLKHIETYGYGLPNIFGDYKTSREQPFIRISENAFVLILPNKNYVPGTDRVNEFLNKPYLAVNHTVKILNYIEQNGSITREEAEQALDIKQSRAYQILRRMKEEGLIMGKKEMGKRVYVIK